MAIHYPNGKAYESGKQTAEDAVNYGGRGMTLEAELNASNQYYRAAKRAVIYKKTDPDPDRQGRLPSAQSGGH